MKRIILILVIILAGVYLGLSAISDSDEYNAERLLYRAGKDKLKIGVNPDVAPPAMIASVEKNLKAVVDDHPKTEAAKTAQLALVEHYIQYKQYGNAIGVVDGIILNTPADNMEILSKMHFVKGNIYEEQKKAEEAVAEYTIIKDKYPDTRMGVQMPVYIGNYYQKIGDNEKAIAAYDEAADMYKKRAEENKGRVMGYIMSTLLAQVYVNSEKFEEAGKVIEDLINTYPAPLTYMQHLPNVDFIFVRKLNNPQKAIEIFKGVKEKVDDEKFIAMLDDRIKGWEAEMAGAASGEKGDCFGTFGASQ